MKLSLMGSNFKKFIQMISDKIKVQTKVLCMALEIPAYNHIHTALTFKFKWMQWSSTKNLNHLNL